MLKTKHRKPFSRLLAVMMSLAMVLALIPATAMAEETSQGGMVLSKTATLEDDGTYTIELSAYATGTTTTVTEKSGVPLDIVLVLDQSGSMYTSEYLTPLKNAVTAFVNTISSNAKDYNVDHRIALVGYASNRNDGKSNSGTISSGSSNSYWINTGLFVDGYLKNYAGDSDTSSLTSKDYKDALVNVNTNGNVTSSITTAISNIAASGATRTNYGMEMANGVFENNPIEENSDRKRIVVVFTDGKPGYDGYEETSANAALAEAYKTKNTYKATVYTVGLYSSADDNVTTFMNYLSSNYPTAQSMIGDTVYEYSPIYSLKNYNSYYVKNEDGSYVKVNYKKSYRGGSWKDSTGKVYIPKTSETSEEGIQFYSRTETTEKPEQSADKYYMTTSNPDELNNIFTNISKDIQNPSTSVKLDKDS
ncbi:MAG: vWA domain-containing protein, partial [Lachnospiraceae bacterium]|nr:vWA domain-containing protein [Lachnospiraceae bacterium]